MTATVEAPADSTGVYGPLPGEPDALRAELLARARALVPVLRERALGAEEARRVPDETVADLRAAGLLAAATPPRFGGYEGTDFDLVSDIALELGRGCMSTAWCYHVWLSHNWMIGDGDLRLQEEYFADGPNTLSSTASSPLRTDFSFTDRGFRTAGHWAFASGSDHSQWFLCGPGVGLLAVCVPRKDVRVLDTWRSPGLKGTGSHEIVIDGADVPSHRAWTFVDDIAPGGPIGWAEYGRASYRLTMWMLGNAIVAPLLGAARGALEVFRDKYHGTGPKPGMQPTTRHSGVTTLQVAYAESAAEVDAATTLWREDYRSVLAQAAAGEPFTLEQRATVRRNQVYAAKLGVRAVTRLFEATGAHALVETDPLQRFFRDVHAAGHHISIPFEWTLADYGAVSLGQPFAMEFQRDGIDPVLVARPGA